MKFQKFLLPIIIIIGAVTFFSVFVVKEINDDFSENVFTSFIDGLDSSKRYFTQEDLKEFSQYKYQIDNQLLRDDITFYKLVYGRFLEKIKNIVLFSKRLKSEILNGSLLKKAKSLGFSDIQIASFTSKNEIEIINMRENFRILPHVKQIDTLAGEWPAKTNYLYLTYNGDEDDVTPYEQIKYSKEIIYYKRKNVIDSYDFERYDIGDNLLDSHSRNEKNKKNFLLRKHCPKYS